TLTIQDLQRLLFCCAVILISSDYTLVHFLVAPQVEIFTPSAVTVSIKIWMQVIMKHPNVEVAIMCEVLTSCFGTVKLYVDPFYHAISYCPTDKDKIDQ
ncbi:hypothetical protein BDR06DRAFT_871468, partial [Suillus hirtellus]